MISAEQRMFKFQRMVTAFEKTMGSTAEGIWSPVPQDSVKTKKQNTPHTRTYRVYPLFAHHTRDPPHAFNISRPFLSGLWLVPTSSTHATPLRTFCFFSNIPFSRTRNDKKRYMHHTAPPIDMNTLCTSDILEDVADFNWTWLTAILSIKCIGLTILICVEIKAMCFDGKDGGEEDAEAVNKCCQSCKHCAADCCKSCLSALLMFTFRLCFLIVGTSYVPSLSLSLSRVPPSFFSAPSHTRACLRLTRSRVDLLLFF